jgi:hypothetical protein
MLGSLSGSFMERIEPAPLSVDAIRRLGGVDDQQAADIHSITKGNPFFVTEVLDADGDGVPATVRDAVLGRVGRLPPAVRKLAERLAVVPSRAERSLAETLAGTEPAAIGILERCGVITGWPEHVAFRHELARRAVEESLPPNRRLVLHRRALEALADPPAARESSLRGSSTTPQPPRATTSSSPWTRRRDRRPGSGAHRQAAETLRVVLQHTDRLDHITRAELLTRRAYP